MSNGLYDQLPLPKNSITYNRINDTKAKDFREVFSFYDFLQNQESRLTPQQYNAAYKNYLNIWSDVKKNSNSQSVQLVRDRYVELLKDISLNYLSAEEKRFLKLADFNDPNDLDVILHLYSKKIINICKYHTEKREKTKQAASKNQERGTINSLEHAIHDSLTEYVFLGDDENLRYNFPELFLNDIINNLDIEIEELFDIYTTYLDNDPSLNFDNYNTKNQLRKTLFKANTNDIDGNIFLDFDAATKKYIFEILSVYLKEAGRNFSINYDLTRVDLNCKTGDKLYDLINKYKDYAENILDLKSELIKKFIGTDFYYIKTGTTINDITQGKLFEAYNPSGNLLNRHYPSTATIEEDSELITLRKLGLFFRPEKTGLLYFSVPKNHFEIDKTKLLPNKIYIYPDPKRYGNTAGLTNNYFYEYPLIHSQDYTPTIRNTSTCAAAGDIFSNPSEQNFFGYIGKNQLSHSKTSNEKSFILNFSSLANKGIISRWNNDIYGNEFALFEPSEFKNYNDSRTDINKQLTSYKIYDGGVMIFDDNTILPSLTTSDSYDWPMNIFSSKYYYNILLDGGFSNIINGLMLKIPRNFIHFDGLSYTTPTIYTYGYHLSYVTTGWMTIPGMILNCGLYTDLLAGAGYSTTLSYDYILSSIQYAELDGGNFTQNEVYEEFDSIKNVFLNEVREDRKTQITATPSIDSKQIYVRNIKNNYITNILEACSGILSKYVYEPSLGYELIYDIEDFNVYNDILYIKTKNYAIFEKYKFDGSFIAFNTPTSILTGNLSDPFYLENKNYALICSVEISGNNPIDTIIIPKIYRLYYNNTQIENINYKFDEGLSATSFNNTLPVAFTNISKPILVHNTRNKICVISCSLFDNNNIPYIYQIFFKFNDIDATILGVNIISLMKENSYKTININNDEYISLLKFNELNSSNVIYKNTTETCLEFYEL